MVHGLRVYIGLGFRFAAWSRVQFKHLGLLLSRFSHTDSATFQPLCKACLCHRKAK